MLSKYIVVVSIKSHVELLHISVQLFSSQNFGNFNQLVVVILSLEEWLLLEDHTRKHTTEGPNIQVVIVSLQVNKQLWTFEVSASYSNIVLLVWMIELSKTPVDQSQLLVVVVDHDVVGLYISVHDAFGVAEVKGLQHFVNVEANVLARERFVQSAEIYIASIHVLHDERRCLGHGISNNVHQVDDIDSTSKGLQDLNFSADLGLLDRLQNFDDDPLVVKRVDALVDLRVLSTTNFLNDLIVFLGPIKN